jgi:glycosyltransferase involved in cell wall biosynthesis
MSVDDIVRAFEKLRAELVVAGDGPERKNLERISGENVEFAGYVSEVEKKELLAGAKAFIFNGQNEDFGISPVEALAAGTPLIGVEEGMTQYQVIEGKSGYTFPRDASGRSIREAVERFEAEGVVWDDAAIKEFAGRFSVGTFQKRMYAALEQAAENADVTPDWYKKIT